jgi:hypothetical protein
MTTTTTWMEIEYLGGFGLLLVWTRDDFELMFLESWALVSLLSSLLERWEQENCCPYYRQGTVASESDYYEAIRYS